MSERSTERQERLVMIRIKICCLLAAVLISSIAMSEENIQQPEKHSSRRSKNRQKYHGADTGTTSWWACIHTAVRRVNYQ